MFIHWCIQNNKLILVISKLIQRVLCVHTQQTFNLTCAAQNGEQSETMSGKILLLPSCTCSECQDGMVYSHGLEPGYAGKASLNHTYANTITRTLLMSYSFSGVA